MAEPILSRLTLAPGFACPKCKSGRVDVVADSSADGEILLTSIEVRCIGCHQALIGMDFEQSYFGRANDHG